MKAIFMSLLAVLAIGSVAQAGRVVADPSECSNAGDEVARPIYNEKGELIGWECVQDNRGGGGGR